MVAALLVGGCGTRLADGEIIKAATHVAVTPGAAPAAGTVGAEAATAAGAAVASGGEQVPTAAGPTGSASGTASAAPTGGSITGGGGTAALGPAAGTGARSATPSAGPAAKTPAGGAAPAATGPNSPAPGATPAQSAAATKSVITIGNVGDYSGIVGSVLKEGGPMAQVVGRHINDNGGLNGHPVKVLVADAAGDPSRGLSIVRDMVENKGAIAFMGNVWVLSASGARAYLEE
jgi:branched-chain amino acid transport system substrate-binding protein